MTKKNDLIMSTNVSSVLPTIRLIRILISMLLLIKQLNIVYLIIQQESLFLPERTW